MAPTSPSRTTRARRDGPRTAAGAAGLTEADVAAGLKQALEVGTKNAVELVTKPDGYYKDQAIKILFPPEVKTIADTLQKLGLGQLVESFVERMNRGAESA